MTKIIDKVINFYQQMINQRKEEIKDIEKKIDELLLMRENE